DVRQRPSRNQRDGTWIGDQGRRDPVDRVRGLGGSGWRRQVWPVEPGFAVHMRGDVALADQGARRAGGDRDLAVADMVKDADRVCRRLVERLVAGDRGHAEQRYLGAGERQQERDRIVVARVAVEDDVRHGAMMASTSAAVGSEGCAPGREAASAPAAQAHPSASERSLPCSSATTSAAQNASPAAVPSTALMRGGRARATSRPPSSSTAPSAPKVNATSPAQGPTSSY